MNIFLSNNTGSQPFTAEAKPRTNTIHGANDSDKGEEQRQDLNKFTMAQLLKPTINLLTVRKYLKSKSYIPPGGDGVHSLSCSKKFTKIREQHKLLLSWQG